MDTIEREILSNHLKSWILQAGKLIRDKINDPRIISFKSNPNDLVTEMDKEVERYFAKKINEFYPDHLLLGEEGYGHEEFNKKDTIWIIDPIDGTMNFVHQKQNFAISLAVYHQGVGEIGYIYDVMNNTLYGALRGNGAFKNDVKLLPLTNESITLNQSVIAFSHRLLMKNRFINEKYMQQLTEDVRGIRSYGSAAIGLARVAEGALDAYITMRLEPWDIAAGRIIVEEVGGIITNASGKEIGLLERSSVIATHPDLHSILVKKYLQKGLKRNRRK
ncbi:MAG TPA: inositol monophosphatase family protein [Pseudogracilibacillus sp.]|nr:inositol monophosphatase family protein [Pseudogracilibacillus sp.]